MLGSNILDKATIPAWCFNRFDFDKSQALNVVGRLASGPGICSIEKCFMNLQYSKRHIVCKCLPPEKWKGDLHLMTLKFQTFLKNYVHTTNGDKIKVIGLNLGES